MRAEANGAPIRCARALRTSEADRERGAVGAAASPGRRRHAHHVWIGAGRPHPIGRRAGDLGRGVGRRFCRAGGRPGERHHLSHPTLRRVPGSVLGGIGPAVGAGFHGRKLHDAVGEWEVPCFVEVFEPDRAFGWSTVDAANHGSRWRYNLVTDGAQTRLAPDPPGPRPACAAPWRSAPAPPGSPLPSTQRPTRSTASCSAASRRTRQPRGNGLVLRAISYRPGPLCPGRNPRPRPARGRPRWPALRRG